MAIWQSSTRRAAVCEQQQLLMLTLNIAQSVDEHISHDLHTLPFSVAQSLWHLPDTHQGQQARDNMVQELIPRMTEAI